MFIAHGELKVRTNCFIYSNLLHAHKILWPIEAKRQIHLPAPLC